MARRRSRSVSFAPLLVVGVLAVGGYFAWKHSATWLPMLSKTPAKADAPEPAAADVEIDVCRLVPATTVGDMLHWRDVSARQVGAAADVPAAGSCTWRFGNRAVVANVFTTASLGDGPTADARGYYDSVVTGFEYALKANPSPISNLGDEAASAGFDEAGGDAQIVVRKGDRVLHLVVRGAPERDAVALARRITTAL